MVQILSGTLGVVNPKVVVEQIGNRYYVRKRGYSTVISLTDAGDAIREGLASLTAARTVKEAISLKGLFDDINYSAGDACINVPDLTIFEAYEARLRMAAAVDHNLIGFDTLTKGYVDFFGGAYDGNRSNNASGDNFHLHGLGKVTFFFRDVISTNSVGWAMIWDQLNSAFMDHCTLGYSDGVDTCKGGLTLTAGTSDSHVTQCHIIGGNFNAVLISFSSTSNTFEGCYFGGSGSAQVSLHGCYNNFFINCENYDTNDLGGYVFDDDGGNYARFNSVKGGAAHNNGGHDGLHSHSNVYLTGHSHGNTIEGVTMYEDNPTYLAKYGVLEDSLANYNHVIGCMFRGQVTNAVVLAGANSVSDHHIIDAF